MNIVYKLSRPSRNDKSIELEIYAENLHDVCVILQKLPKDQRLITKLEIIPIVHF